MSKFLNWLPGTRRQAIWLGPLLILLLGLVLLRSCIASQSRPLKPDRAESAAIAPGSINRDPIQITFAELNQNPGAYMDKRIRVSGNYRTLSSPDCKVPKGPDIRWALVADELQLDAIGFERVLSLVSPGITLTVDGIWRVYNGPTGCGKDPARNSRWYLAVEKIVAPNPLIGGDSTAINQPPISGTGDTPDPIAAPTVASGTPASTADATAAADGPTDTATATLVPATRTTMTATPFSISTRTPVGGTPGTTATPTATIRSGSTPTITATSTAPTNATQTPTVVVTTLFQTRTPSPTPIPLQTATPGGGYPGPVETPTATPDSYP